MSCVNTDKEIEVGTGTLDGTNNNEKNGLMMNIRGNNDQNKRKTQLSITQFTTRRVERGNTTALMEGGNTENIGNLYDIASNVSMLRELRGKCVICDGCHSVRYYIVSTRRI